MSQYPWVIRSRLSDTVFDSLCEYTNRSGDTISSFVRKAVGEKLQRGNAFSDKDVLLIAIRKNAKEVEGKLLEYQRQLRIWRTSGALSVAENIVALCRGYDYLSVPNDVQRVIKEINGKG